MIPPELQTHTFRPYISPPSNFSGRSRPLAFSTSPAAKSPADAGPSRRSLAGTLPGAFIHNARVAVALLPCAAFLLDIGGAPVAATLTVGLMVAYILDSVSLKSASFMAVLISLLFSQIAFFFSSYSFLSSSFHGSLPLTFLASFLCAHTTFLIAVWSSLQFKSFHLQNPQSLLVALERLLFASLPFSATALFAWAAISAVGFSAASASYYLMAFNCLFYFLYSVPRASSFSKDSFVLGQLESCFHCLNLVFLPLLFHIASHHSTIFSSAGAVADLFLLFFVPFLFLLYASTRGALWWLTDNELHLRSIRIANGAVAMVIVVICLEIRVVFHSFGRYVQVPAPFNYLLVTTVMLGGAAASASYALGLVSDAFGSLVFTALGVVVSAAGAIVVGFPLLVLNLITLLLHYA